MAAKTVKTESVAHKPLSGKRRRTNVQSDPDCAAIDDKNNNSFNKSAIGSGADETSERTDISLSSATDDHASPLVFICCGCEAIFGDSFDWVRHDDHLATITLKRASKKVQVGEKLVGSTHGKDIGSAYVKLSCTSCNADVGRMYKTTSRPLDDLRDLYTFHVDKIDFYEVGSAGTVTSQTDELLDKCSRRSKRVKSTVSQ